MTRPTEPLRSPRPSRRLSLVFLVWEHKQRTAEGRGRTPRNSEPSIFHWVLLLCFATALLPSMGTLAVDKADRALAIAACSRRLSLVFLLWGHKQRTAEGRGRTPINSEPLISHWFYSYVFATLLASMGTPISHWKHAKQVSVFTGGVCGIFCGNTCPLQRERAQK